MNYAGRIAAVGAALGALGVDGLVVSAPPNILYLSGFSGSSGLLVLWSEEHRRPPLFLSDFRYTTQAKGEVPSFYDQAFVSAAEGGRELADLLGERLGGGGGRLGFESDHLTVAALAKLERGVPAGWQLTPVEGVVATLRARKEREEVERIARAAALADTALKEVLGGGLEGRSEQALAAQLAYRMRLLGAEGEAFPAIVASGAHGALPHAQAREEPIKRGSLVTVDWGARLDGYCSDCTRTFAVGRPSERARELYGLVLAAQQRALDGLRAGVAPSAVDRLARELIEEAGFGPNFGHSLGHGVGLEVHEGPRLGPVRQGGEEGPLAVGNVVTVEPGIYVEGELGVRIEELVVIGEGSNRLLTSLPRDLMEL